MSPGVTNENGMHIGYVDLCQVRSKRIGQFWPVINFEVNGLNFLIFKKIQLSKILIILPFLLGHNSSYEVVCFVGEWLSFKWMYEAINGSVGKKRKKKKKMNS